MRKPQTSHLPDFPWDTLSEAKQRAGEHPDGVVDLSVGTPVDPVPEAADIASKALSTGASATSRIAAAPRPAKRARVPVTAASA